MAVLQRLGHYRVTASLGEGGMGQVYAAVDERLERPVALKILHADTANNDAARERFRREARLAASVSHPHVCQLYEIGETDGQLFIVMELLDGESLATRLQGSPLSIDEAVDIALEVLDAVDVLHRRGIVHRDLKPSNIFLTRYGSKLLDFGIARLVGRELDETRATLTTAGTVMGTVKYMAPEQLQDRAVDTRADLFSIGAVLYEMVSGRAPFEGGTLAALVDQIMHRDSPVLGGSPRIAAVDRVIHKALAKAAADRYATAADMAADLRGAVTSARGPGSSAPARAVTRVIVLPFRLLRPDPEIDFLSHSLADAITNSLAVFQSLVLRPTLTAARLVSDSYDVRSIAKEADVDLLVSGTLLRAGEQLRVTAQLISADAGTILWTHSAQTPLGDVFRVQDDVARHIVESLALPLSGKERALTHDVPSSAKAYEFYLRANGFGHDMGTWDVARDLYLQCVHDDPHYAPAWARLGRIYRLMGKYHGAADNLALAEAAFSRALALNPELSIADNYYAQLELDLGRAEEAMVRLVRRAASRGNNPDLFAALVSACRYCGLLQPSIAAHERAHRLDPNVRTSVQHTYFMTGDYLRAAELSERRWEAGNMGGLALACAGHPGAEALMRADAERYKQTALRSMLAIPPLIEGNRTLLRAVVDELVATFPDPEAHFYNLLMLGRLGDWDRAVEILSAVVDRGFFPYETFVRHAWLDPARGREDFKAVLERAQQRHDRAKVEYARAGGEGLLGPA